MPRYVPILKAKPAEFVALREARTAERRAMLPLVELLSSADDADPAALESEIAVQVGRLRDAWGGKYALAVDTIYLADTLPLTGGRLAVEVISDLAKGLLRVIPVARLTDDPSLTQAIQRVAAKDKHGVVLRIGGDDLQEDVADINIWITDTLRDLGLTPAAIDLVVDLGPVDANSASLATRAARSLVRNVVHLPDWRTLTLASGAFPTDLSQVPAQTIGTLPRFDATIWTSVTSRPLNRKPDFGDYAVQHPQLATGVPFAPAPQLRYTIDGDWLIYKGSKRNPRGSQQFYDHCAHLVGSGNYSGAGFSFGDEYIDGAAASAPSGATPVVGPGNPTTWRQVGTSHHLAFIVDRLASLGVP